MLEKIKHLIKKNKNEKKSAISDDDKRIKKNIKKSKGSSTSTTTTTNCTISPIQQSKSNDSFDYENNSDIESDNLVENEKENEDLIYQLQQQQKKQEEEDRIKEQQVQQQINDIKIPTTITTTTKSSFLRTVSSQLINITKNLKSNSNHNSSVDDEEEDKEEEQNQMSNKDSSNKVDEEDDEEMELNSEFEESEEFEDYFDLKEIDSIQSKHFNCLSPDQLIEHQKKEIKDIAELLSINISTATSLLKHFHWKRELLIQKYFESPKDILKEVGIEQIQTHSIHSTPSSLSINVNSNNSSSSNNNNYMCNICGDEYNNDSITINSQCKHYFCNECWAGYISSKISEGEAMLRCPHYKCGNILEDSLVQRLVAPFIYEKYQLFTTKKFIQQNLQLRYCPTPGCDNTITLKSDSTDAHSSESVQCSCGYKFCFKCHRESHAPATCDQMSSWEAKCQDESEVSHWKIANCKKCPKCQISIEKNGGCMHITCVKCTYEWCWMCLKSWKGHNDYYVCNRFQKEKETSKRFLFFGKLIKKKESSEEEERKASQQELERYLHYYERYFNHENSRKLEKIIREEAKRKMEELEKANSTWAEVQFIEKGIDQLLDCRNVLKFTYIFAFFNFKDSNDNQNNNNSSSESRVEMAKELFEFLQEDLEKTTERLSELMEDIMKKSVTLESSQRLEIMNYITFVKSKKEGLLNAISKDSLFEF